MRFSLHFYKFLTILSLSDIFVIINIFILGLVKYWSTIHHENDGIHRYICMWGGRFPLGVGIFDNCVINFLPNIIISTNIIRNFD